ncbi:MarR family winged helix-turn-helix transcriptional regulator [Nocardia testacea]|uniref:MarR family winged helix-turn-helix transcriptional regulator n=1 Tax=Nocardia testacea TaxID=248551 RepID=A0ABW7VZP6_9NOCA
MDVRQLHRVIQRLTDLAREVALSEGDPPSSPAELTVLDDVVSRPGSSVRQITERTGLVQSQVSTTVARLAGRGLVRTEVDPADRRRTLVFPSAALLSTIEERTARSVDELLGARFGTAEAERVVGMLAGLDAALSPFAGERGEGEPDAG